MRAHTCKHALDTTERSKRRVTEGEPKPQGSHTPMVRRYQARSPSGQESSVSGVPWTPRPGDSDWVHFIPLRVWSSGWEGWSDWNLTNQLRQNTDLFGAQLKISVSRWLSGIRIQLLSISTHSVSVFLSSVFLFSELASFLGRFFQHGSKNSPRNPMLLSSLTLPVVMKRKPLFSNSWSQSARDYCQRPSWSHEPIT